MTPRPEQDKEVPAALSNPVAVMEEEEVKDSNFLNDSKGYYLRWSRLIKTVDVKEAEVGFLGARSSSMMSTSFRNSTTTVTAGGGSVKRPTKKTILNSVSGYAAPGEVLACMGPSGSGKTSLMNVLSGRGSYQGGVLSINGKPVTAHTMKRSMSKVAYVKQADIFFDHLTVRDQLAYTALLRMPSSKSTQEKLSEVDRLIRLLRLGKVADSQIKMISGGEKKRVNIGTELLTDPLVLLLDEPTSGLDSTSAVSLLKLLQRFARDNRKTVITTIHQPSSATFRSFDRLLMLSEGNVVYFGTPVDSLDYLRKLNLATPEGYNAADHWMDLLVIDHAVEEERLEQVEKNNNEGDEEHSIEGDAPRTGELRRRRADQAKLLTSPRLILQEAWDGEAVAENLDQETDTIATVENASSSTAAAAGEADFLGSSVSKYNTSWGTQYYVLTHRALRNSRSAIFTPLNLIKSVLIGAIAGLLWYQTPYTEKRVDDIRSYFFFTMTFWVFDSMFTALTAFPAERTVILKERASGSYHLSAYFLAKTTADAPVRLVLPLLYMTISYWMAGIDNRFSAFIGSIACTLLSVLAGEAIGLTIGAGIYDLQRAITTMTVGALFLMLVGGFFIQNVPSFMLWGKYLSPFKYAFDSSLQIVFDRDVPCDGSGALPDLCSAGQQYAKAADVRNYIDIQGSMAFNVGLLLVLSFVPRYFAYHFLRAKKGGERS